MTTHTQYSSRLSSHCSLQRSLTPKQFGKNISIGQVLFLNHAVPLIFVFVFFHWIRLSCSVTIFNRLDCRGPGHLLVNVPGIQTDRSCALKTSFFHKIAFACSQKRVVLTNLSLDVSHLHLNYFCAISTFSALNELTCTVFLKM